MGAAFALALIFLGGCQTASHVADHAIGWIPGIHKKDAASHPAPQQTVRAKGLEFTLRLEPFPVKLADTRRVTAQLSLKNKSTRFVRLEFPTTQRFEVIVRDAAGKPLVQWSEDQAFEEIPGSVSINPGEHLEYSAVLATRDLLPGQRYTVTASFPGQAGLSVELPLVPEP